MGAFESVDGTFALLEAFIMRKRFMGGKYTPFV
jgi:hypothetical protein